MTFTDKQGIKLRKKIETALSPFPEDKLKNIFLEYQGIFGANFYNEISGSNDRSKIITLIENNTIHEEQLKTNYVNFILCYLLSMQLNSLYQKLYLILQNS